MCSSDLRSGRVSTTIHNRATMIADEGSPQGRDNTKSEDCKVPDFKNAEVTTVVEDLSQYKAFLSEYKQGQVVKLPLTAGETPRRVMRALNKAAAANGVRLIRLRSGDDEVRFRITSPERRVVNLSEEARRARVEKARETRARNRAAAQA